MATGVPAALTAILTVLLGLSLTGCAATSTTSGTQPGAEASPGKPAVDSFRSTRTYRAVAPPVRLRIPAAHIETALQRLGRAHDGTIQLPSRPDIAGWYAEGPRPGQP